MFCKKEGCMNPRKIFFELCNSCVAKICAKCKAIHTHFTCYEYQMIKNNDVSWMEAEFLKLVQREQIRQCPICKTYIQIISGCENVMCSYCKVSVRTTLHG